LLDSLLQEILLTNFIFISMKNSADGI